MGQLAITVGMYRSIFGKILKALLGNFEIMSDE